MQTPVQQTAVTSDVAVNSAPGALCGVVLTAGSDLATLILYDNTAASGTILVTLKAAANTTVAWEAQSPRAVSKGIYADISGTGPAAYVGYW